MARWRGEDTSSAAKPPTLARLLRWHRLRAARRPFSGVRSLPTSWGLRWRWLLPLLRCVLGLGALVVLLRPVFRVPINADDLALFAAWAYKRHLEGWWSSLDPSVAFSMARVLPAGRALTDP